MLAAPAGDRQPAAATVRATAARLIVGLPLAAAVSPSRRQVLAAAAGTTGLAAGAGCLVDGGPSLVEAAGVVPTAEGYLAGGTTGEDGLDRAPLGTWVAGLAPDGAVRFRRHHEPGRWSGTDRVAACCGLDGGALLVGRRTRADVVVDDALVHAVAADGATRWRRTLPAASSVVDAVAVEGGAVLAGVDEGDPPAAWVAGLAPDGAVRWAHRHERRLPSTVRATAGGEVVVAGHAVGDDAPAPWLLALSDGAVVARRRYQGDALAGWRLAGLVDRSDGVTAVAVPVVPAATTGPAARLLPLDADWRPARRRPLALADDQIRADDDRRSDDPVRFVGAVPTGDDGLVAAVGEGGWTTVATFDADRTRVAETLLQARTVSVGTDADGALLFAGSRRGTEGARDAWLARLEVGRSDDLRDVDRWTTTLSVG